MSNRLQSLKVARERSIMQAHPITASVNGHAQAVVTIAIAEEAEISSAAADSRSSRGLRSVELARHPLQPLYLGSMSALPRRSALPITDTDDRLIAAAASMGESSQPSSG